MVPEKIRTGEMVFFAVFAENKQALQKIKMPQKDLRHFIFIIDRIISFLRPNEPGLRLLRLIQWQLL